MMPAFFVNNFVLIARFRKLSVTSHLYEFVCWAILLEVLGVPTYQNAVQLLEINCTV